jgi:hypothetical protein
MSMTRRERFVLGTFSKICTPSPLLRTTPIVRWMLMVPASRSASRQRSGQTVDDLLQVGGQGPHALQRRLVVEGPAGVGDELLGAGLLLYQQVVLELADELVGLVSQRVEVVAGVYLLAPALVLGRVLNVGDHLLDVGLHEVGRLLDLHPLLGTGVLIAGWDVEDAIGVGVEGDLDLGKARRAGRMPSSRKRASWRLSAASSRSPRSTTT